MKIKILIKGISLLVFAGIALTFFSIPKSYDKSNNISVASSTEIQAEATDNLDMSNATVDFPENVCTGALEVPELFVDKDEFCKSFFDLTKSLFELDNDLYNDSIIAEGYYPIGPDVSYDNFFASIGCNGFCTVAFSDEEYNPTGDRLIDIINLSNYEDKTCELSNGSANISEYVEFANNYFDQYCDLFNVEALPVSVSILESEESSQYMMIRYQQSIDGVCIANITSTYDMQFNEKYYPMEFGHILITGLDKSDIINITIQNVINLSDSTDYKPEISYDEAVNILSKTLSEYKQYSIENACVEYLLTDKGNRNEEGKNLHFASLNYFSIEPYWTFYIDKTYSKEIVAYVNCRNGEVQFVNNQ